MAYIFRRGATVPFTQTYYDSTGGIVSPSSATVTITYPSTDYDGHPFNDIGGVVGGAWKTTTVTLTTNSSGELVGTWPSSVSWPGWVFYTISAANSSLDTVDGEFELRGNPANKSRT